MADTPLTMEQIIGELYVQLRVAREQINVLAKEGLEDASTPPAVDRADDPD